MAQATTPTEETTPTTATAPPASDYPVVHWQAGEWPFTVQLLTITKDPEGYAGLGSAPPGHDWLMVRASITSTTPDRGTGAPTPELRCTAPNGGSWNANDDNTVTPELTGYEEDPNSTELAQPYDVGFSPGEAHTWASEWEVPENTNTEAVTCGVISGGSAGATTSLME